MTQEDYERHLRAKFAEKIEVKFRPQLNTYYDCCGCSTIDDLLNGIVDSLREGDL